MYLNTDSLNVEFITSKSSEMNVMIPKTNGDYVSMSPVDLKTMWLLQLYKQYYITERVSNTGTI